MNLEQKHCKPCEGGMPPLSPAAAQALSQEITEWHIDGDKKLEKTFTFKDFSVALAFVNNVGKIAEQEDHHPDISLFNYKKVRIELSTHAIGGLSENDFILAAKIDELLRD